MAFYDAKQIHTKRVSETRNISLDISGYLDDGELATGTVTMAVSGADAVLTTASPAVSTGALTIEGVSVPTGEALTVSVVAGTAGVRYGVQFSVATDAMPAQALVLLIAVDVIADT